MKLFLKIDTETGEEYAGVLKSSDLPLEPPVGFRVILPNQSDIVYPVDGELAKDDDYIYIYNQDLQGWKRVGVAIANI